MTTKTQEMETGTSADIPPAEAPYQFEDTDIDTNRYKYYRGAMVAKLASLNVLLAPDTDDVPAMLPMDDEPFIEGDDGERIGFDFDFQESTIEAVAAIEREARDLHNTAVRFRWDLIRRNRDHRAAQRAAAEAAGEAAGEAEGEE